MLPAIQSERQNEVPKSAAVRPSVPAHYEDFAQTMRGLNVSAATPQSREAVQGGEAPGAEAKWKDDSPEQPVASAKDGSDQRPDDDAQPVEHTRPADGKGAKAQTKDARAHSTAKNGKHADTKETAGTGSDVAVPGVAAASVSVSGTEAEGLAVAASDADVPTAETGENSGVSSSKAEAGVGFVGKISVAAGDEEAGVPVAAERTVATHGADRLQSHAQKGAAAEAAPGGLLKVDAADNRTAAVAGLNAGVAHQEKRIAASAPARETRTASAAGAASSDWTVQSYEATSSHRLEVGVAGGTFGWLKVRAEIGQGGEVHTFLRGASSAAESELRSQTMDLQSYLGAQQVRVHTVSVEASRTQGWKAMADGGDSGQRREQSSSSETRAPARGMAARGEESDLGRWMPARQSFNGAGRWLNVLA